jgi:hypothetical protein
MVGDRVLPHHGLKALSSLPVERSAVVAEATIACALPHILGFYVVAFRALIVIVIDLRRFYPLLERGLRAPRLSESSALASFPAAFPQL